MSTSGTYAFAPGFSDFILNAFSRIQIHASALTQEQMVTAAMEGNLLLSQISNLQPNLWTSDLQSQSLTQGTATYTLSATTVAILIAYISTGTGDNIIDRVIGPVSATQYASFPNKVQQGVPSVYWFDRQITPQITLWQPPDNGGPYTLKYRRVRQVQDAVVGGALNIETPYRFYDAFVTGLAHRLSRHYAPALEQLRKADAVEAWHIASTQDIETTPMLISPMLSGYFS